jgi:predicted transcriptional regulator
MVGRARFAWNPNELRGILEDHEMTVAGLAKYINITERHIYNVLEGKTELVRYKTKKKVAAGLEARGIKRPLLFS